MNGKGLTLIFVFAMVMSLVILGTTSCNVTKPENTNQKPNAQNGEKTETETKESPNPDNFSGKTYQKMSGAEQNKFVAAKTDEFLQNLGFEKSEKINGKGLEMIKPFVDGYARRLDTEPKSSCGFRDLKEKVFLPRRVFTSL
jgi:hypothetical protein